MDAKFKEWIVAKFKGEANAELLQFFLLSIKHNPANVEQFISANIHAWSMDYAMETATLAQTITENDTQGVMVAIQRRFAEELASLT